MKPNEFFATKRLTEGFRKRSNSTARGDSMKIEYGKGKTEFGPGIAIELTGDEVAIAIDAYLLSHGVHVLGPRTITVNGELCEDGLVYVDPSGSVVNGDKRWKGRGKRS